MRKNLMSKVLAGALAAAMTVTSVFPAFAANVNETNNLTNRDVIDTSLTGSLTITKYDMTAAELANAYTEGTYRATGDQNDDLETAMADYALEGVQFTYLKVGEIEQYSHTDNTTGETSLKVVYEIPTALAGILGLDGVTDTDGDTSNDATDMSAAGGVADPCTNSGVLHYTSDQINAALSALLVDNVTGKNALEDYVTANASSQNMDLTDSNGQTSADGLALGLYLIVETTVPENVNNTTDPFFVSLPMTNLDETAGGDDGGESWIYDVYVYPKNQTGNPTLDKMVRNATGTAATAAGTSEGTDYIVTNTTDTYATYGALTDQNGDNTKNETDFAIMRGDGSYASETTIGEYEYASTTTASTGDVLDYILVSQLPKITSNASALTQYTFVDTLSKGLTYNSDMKVAFYASAADANINNTKNAVEIWTIAALGATEYFTVDEQTNADGATVLTVSMTAAGLKEINGVNADGDTIVADSYSEMYMVVYYTATVNADDTTVLGDNGNTNDVQLTWSRTSDSDIYYETLEDESIVYVYGIDLTKQFADGSTNYTDVEFTFYNQTDGYYVVASQVMDNGVGTGVYYVTGKALTEADATVFTPNADGQAQVLGLEADSYILTELATADGYNLLDEAMMIDISSMSKSIQATIAGYTGIAGTAMTLVNTTEAAAAVDGVGSTLTAAGGSEHALVKLVVLNTQSFVLPITGGAGLYAVTIIGVIAIAAGLYFFFGRRSRKKDAQAQ